MACSRVARAVSLKFLSSEIVTLFSCMDNYQIMGGPGSAVGIVTALRAGRSGGRIPVGARISAPVQTGPGPTQLPVQWVPGLSRG